MDRIIDVTISDKGEIKNVDFVAWIMNEIEGAQFTRQDIAATYAILLQKATPLATFVSINKAIIKHRSPAALRWIKEQAWRQAKAERMYGATQ